MEKRKLAVVTGGTRGIGCAIAKRLLKDGMDVIVTGTKSDGICTDGASYYEVDFLKNDSVNEFVEYLKQQKIDILINNAAINKIGEFAAIDIDDFDSILKVNLRTPLLLCQAVIPHMKKKKWGRIINLTSIFGSISKKYRASYSSSKFGLDGMTVALSAELSEFNILANSVAPGFIDTDLTRNILGEGEIAELQDLIPMKRLGMVDEIASLISWLVSDENSYITGQNLLIDGGFSRV